MSVDIVTPFDFDNPSSLPPGAQKFTTIGPSIFKSRMRASTTSADRPRQHDSPLDEFPRTHEPTPVLAEESPFSRATTPQPQRRARSSVDVAATNVSAEYVQTNAVRSPGKPKQIKILDWRRPNTPLSVDDDLPSIAAMLAQLDQQLEHYAGTKRKESPQAPTDEYEGAPTSYDRASMKRAANKRAMRRLPLNDDTADPLAPPDDAFELDFLVNQMEDF